MRRALVLVLFACLVWYTHSAYGRFPWVASGGGGVGGSVTLTDVTIAGLHSVSFTAPASANTALGTIVVSATGGSFSGSLSLSGTDAASLHIVGSTLETQASGTLCASPPCSYIFNIVATQGGATGSPFTQAFTGSGTASGCGAIIVPLSGCSLTTSRGTVTFATTQMQYGYDVLLNGVTAGIEATALTVSSGLLIAKYDTGIPSPGPTTQCMQETTEISNTTRPMAFFTNPVTCPGGM